MRAILDGVVVKERQDLDEGLTTIPGFVFPEISHKSSPEVTPDHMAYGQVVSIGPGSINCPRIRGIVEGSVVLYDLANIDHAYYDSETETGYQKMSQKALAGILVEGEVKALTDWVITEQDNAAMKRFAGGSIELTDEVLINGVRTDSRVDGSMRMVAERVVSAGIGRRYAIKLLPRDDPKRLAYDDIRAPDRWVERMSVPLVVKGDVVAFTPSASTRFRRNGRWYRATPWDELSLVLEER